MIFIKQALFAFLLLACTLQSVDFATSRITADPLQRAACVNGVKIDERDRRDVVVELRKQDANWYPAVPANTYLENRITAGDATRLIPLGGVANAQVVGCNDSGYYSTFTTDAFGFNNPPDAWEKGPKKKLFFLGDSYTQGDCRRPGESIVDQVRARIPGVINLGSGGNGPLLELAAIREYIPKGEVAQVFWMYSEGSDLQDIERDKQNELLTQYLTPDFSQKLQERQSEVNEIVRQYVEKLIANYVENRTVIFPNLRLAIWDLRHKTQLSLSHPAPIKEYEPVDLALFEKIIARAKYDVEAKGGRLTFVYLPEYSRFSNDQPSNAASYK